MSPITYTSEQPKEWARALWDALTLEQLRRLVEEWRELCPDACEVVERMSEYDFGEFRAGLAKERRGEFAGYDFSERYADVTLPRVLVLVSDIALRFRVPWGCAYLRLKETGNLQKALA